MAIQGLTIIGESINDSVPSTKKLFEAGDWEGLKDLARTQDERGAAYIDVNVGRRPPAFMADLVRGIQGVTARPLSIDTPDLELARAGLSAYDPRRAGGKKPILNSVAATRMELLDLHSEWPFWPILMVSERAEGGEARPNRSAEETHQTARDLLAGARERTGGLPNAEVIIDVGIAPVGSDSEGITRRVLDSMRRIHEDPFFEGAHLSVGLSNFTVMLPSKRPDGMPVKGTLESAFLTRAIPLGLDMIIGSMSRKYELLPPDHTAMRCLDDVLGLEGFDAVIRVKEFYEAADAS